MPLAMIVASLTDPVLAIVRPITPHAVPFLLVLVFATLWLLVLRFALQRLKRHYDDLGTGNLIG